MATQIDIANMALVRLGEEPIASLSNLTDRNARLLALQFDPARDEVLQAHPWSIALKRDTLAQLVDAPEFGWTYAYQLPADFLRFLRINGADAWSKKEWFAIEQQQLLCDYDSVEVIYVFRQTNYHQYPGALADALAMVLASRVAASITGNYELGIGLRREADRALHRAAALDARETSSNENAPILEAIRNSQLVTMRQRTYFIGN